jgi:hypothetical protein
MAIAIAWGCIDIAESSIAVMSVTFAIAIGGYCGILADCDF